MYLGVDFGTSFSQAATMHNGHPLVLLPSDTYGIPSEFYYKAEHGVQVGKDALCYAEGINVKYLVSECKMKLLQRPNEVMLDDRSFTYANMAKNIYCYVLHIAKNMAERKLIKTNVDGLVLTMPVRFGYQEKSLLKEAAQNCLGGTPLRVMDVLKEPVAAAIAYYKDSLDDGKTILVFDLGGGTCDVALVRSDKTQREMFTVLDDDMERVGGRDWDKALMNYISTEVEKKTGVRIIDHDYYLKQLKTMAEEIKKKLSDGFSTVANAVINMQNGRIVQVRVTLNIFEEITYDLMTRALECLNRVYAKNSAKYKIDEIICVGGSSNMRQVRYNIKNAFPDMLVRLYEPEHAVVNGAAIYAELIHNDPTASVLSDVSVFSYGIRAYEDYDKDPNKLVIFNIVYKSSKLPTNGKHSFSTTRANQSAVDLNVFESENTSCKFELDQPHTHIGRVTFPLPPNARKGYSITCEMTLKGDGFLYFNAVDEAGKSVPAQFKLSK